jgi:propanol-preferring alcohol dehydrogenase
MQMRAAVLPDFKAPLEIQDVPVTDPGTGEVLVRVAGAGLCRSDLHLLDGEIAGLPPHLPWILGHEVTGYVEALGSGVTGLRHGLPVAVFGGWGCGRCRACVRGEEQLCTQPESMGIHRAGGFAEFVVVPSARHLVPLGDLDPVSSAPLTDAALSSYRAVRKGLSRLVPGSTAVVIGAGGLGQYAIQLLRHLTPARVVAIEPMRQHHDVALELGADRVLRPDDEESLRQLRFGVDVVLDVVGSDSTLATASQLAGRGGLIVVVGMAGGTLPVRFFSPTSEVVVTTSHWGTRPELTEVVALAAAGRLTSRTHEVDLAGVNSAISDLRTGDVAGRVVLVP